MEIGNSTLWDKLKYLLIALFPILSLYNLLPLVNLGFFFLLDIIIIEIIRKKMDIDMNLNILIMMVVFMMLNLVNGVLRYSDTSNTVNNTAGMIVFTFIAVFFCQTGFIDKEKLYRACLFVGIIATMFVVVQYIAYYNFHMVVKGNVPFLTPVEMRFESIEYGRPTSFFYEPAHYCIYIAPLLAMAIIRKEYVVALILFVGILFSTSTTGIVLLVLVPIIIFLSKSKSFVYIIIFAATIVLIFNYLPENFYDYLSKLNLTNLLGNVRVFGTVSFFQYFSLNEWFFGVGHNRMADFLSQNRASYSKNYASSFVFIIFSSGIVGLLILLNHCRIMYNDIMDKYKVLWFILLFILFSDQILFNRNFLYLLIWIYAVSEKPESKFLNIDEALEGGS